MGLLALALAACDGPPGPAMPPAAIGQLDRQTVRVDGRSLSYLAAGDPAGRRVILVHGTPGDATGWADFLGAVPPGFHYLAVDRLGFGQSDPASEPALARQAAALLPLLGGELPPILVGHSLGAPIVTQLAVDHPGRVGALVLVAGSLDPGLERIHWAQPIAAWPPLKALLPRALANANAELMALEPQLAALAPRLAALRCPVVIVHGTKDGLVPYANTDFMAARMPNARMAMATLEGADHFLPWNQRAAVEAAIARAAAMAGPPC